MSGVRDEDDPHVAQKRLAKQAPTAEWSLNVAIEHLATTRHPKVVLGAALGRPLRL